MGQNTNRTPFSRMELADAIRLWEHAPISLIDIRHTMISSGEAMRDYYLPASAFVYTSGAQAEVLLDNNSFLVERFGLFHGAKGTQLTIRPSNGWLEYYMLLYKIGEPSLHKKEFARLLKRTNPFQQQYGFAPSNPLYFGHQLRLMYEKWKGPTPLNLFYGKAAFYQLVYEVYEELDKGNIQTFEADLIGMARRYFDQNYNKAITVQEVCAMLGISYSHFHRRFTKQVGQSPQDYLIKARLSAAMDCLNGGKATIREIAEYCGFQDERNFHRLFVKNQGMSPTQYRKNLSDCKRDYTLQNSFPFPYNGESQVSLDELKGKGATFMLKQIRSNAVVAAMLSLMLIMSACGTAPTTNKGSNTTSTSVVTSQISKAEGTEPVEEGTKTISTVKGDVEVPVNPQRIVSYYISGNIYAFDIEPIGIDSAYEGAGFAGLVETAQIVDFNNSEEVMALEPDLIILSNDYFYDDMAKIAPTIYVPYETPLEEQITFLGEILSQEEKAKEILANYQKTVEENKQAIADAGILDQTVTVVEGGFDNMRIHGPTYIGAPAILYSVLGFKAPDQVEQDILIPGKSGSGFSLETLPQYTGDILVQFVWDGMDDMSTNPVWTSLPAVKNGKLIEIPFSMAHYPDVLSQIQQIEYLADALLALQ